MPLWIVSVALFWSFTMAHAAAGKSELNDDVLLMARSFANGGRYNWSGSGTPEPILFNGQTILPAGNGTYCSGFTFTVVMRTAAGRGLLAGKTVEQIRRFQKEWYGATPSSREVQAGLALKNLGIGSSVSSVSARAGDFVQFWRLKDTGHSAVFLGWVEKDGRKIGFRYRSTQKSTDGIGDRTEYFADVTGQGGEVVRKRTYFARLKKK